jgi:hypothetical protein
MPPITWTVIAEIVVKYGVPFAEQLIANIQNNTPVTAAEWNTLAAKIETPFAVLVPKVGP